MEHLRGDLVIIIISRPATLGFDPDQGRFQVCDNLSYRSSVAHGVKETGGREIVCNFVCGQTFSLSNKLLEGANQSLGKTLDCKTVDIATSFLPCKTFFPCFIEFKSLLFLHRWFLWTA